MMTKLNITVDKIKLSCYNTKRGADVMPSVLTPSFLV